MIDAKAYVLRETGVIPELEDIHVDDRLESGQVLVRVSYSGLCATQLEEIYVSSRNKKYMPHLFGHEGVGVIEAVGPGVTTKQVGETCVIHWRKSSVGMDANPGQYWKGSERINAGPVITFSEYVVVPENRITALPPSLRSEYSSLLGCAYPTGWGSVRLVGELSPADVVLVVGLGGVGLSAVASSAHEHSPSIAIVEPNLRRVEAISQSSKWRTVPELDFGVFESLSPTLVVETSGDTHLLEKLLEWSRPGTRIVLVGMPIHGRKALLSTQKLLDGVKILGSNGGMVDYGLHSEAIFTDFERDMSSGQYPPVLSLGNSELSNAIQSHSEGRYWRVVLEF